MTRPLPAGARVGLLGGTFDPIHLGHLAAAQEAQCRLGLAAVIFMPAGRPPHKPLAEVSPAEDRWQMVTLAIADNPGFTASRLEIERPGPSYTVETLRRLRQEYPGREWYFITGADALLELESWREPAAVVELCRLVAVTRPGYDRERLQRFLSVKYGTEPLLVPTPGVAVSSTELRQRVREGLPLRYLTPDSVLSYINKRQLYK